GMDTVEFWQEAGELPGILLWALAGLHELRQQGRFVVPAVCQQAVDKLRLDTNPARRFLQEHYRAGDGEVLKADLYEAYRVWCADNGHHPLAEVGFGREVFRAFPRVRSEQRSLGGKRPYFYLGLVPLGDGG